MTQDEFKEKARKLLFNSQLRDFPVVFEMYTRSFGLTVDLDETMAQILAIVRTSKDASTAYEMVSHFLDGLE
jgi:hypothetical protein